jgi:hypothetical protein
MRFRRRITIAPGLRLNLSGSGLGLSIGPRGASVSINKRGVWGNTSIPGVGLYQRQKLSGRSSGVPTSRGMTRREREAELLDEFYAAGPRLTAPLAGGAVELIDRNGAPLALDVQEVAWKYLRSELLEQLTARCKTLNADIQSLATLHHQTPAPVPALDYTAVSFEPNELKPPLQVSYHWLWKLFPWHRNQVDLRNEQLREAFLTEHRRWLDARGAHDRAEGKRHELFLLRNEGKHAGTENFIDWYLSALQWPQSTSLELILDPNGRRLSLDVDFPEIEDLPKGVPEVAARARALRVKPFSDAARRKLYAAHIHAVMFRLIGEAFHAVPALDEVIASGHSQRPDKATGVIRDEYLISVPVSRAAWQEIDFNKLEHVDPIEALARFPVRRKMTKTGMFNSIEPFE